MLCEVSENRRLRHASVRSHCRGWAQAAGARPTRHPASASGLVRDYPRRGQERRNGGCYPRSGPRQPARWAGLQATPRISSPTSPPNASATWQGRPFSLRQQSEQLVRQRRASRRSRGKTVFACGQARIRRCRRRAKGSAHDGSEALWLCIQSARPERFRFVRGTGLIGGVAGHGPGCGRMLGQLP